MWKHGASGYSNYKCRCDICRKAWSEHQRDYQARYRSEHKAEKLAYYAEYYEANKVRLGEKRRSPRGKAMAARRERKRTALRKAQFVEDVDRLVLYQMHGGCCGVCKQFVPKDAFEADHIVPLIRGGLHCYANMQPTHPRCNREKGFA
jgi:5-methylcytosine-specific restriction endonuclease McrA